MQVKLLVKPGTLLETRRRLIGTIIERYHKIEKKQQEIED